MYKQNAQWSIRLHRAATHSVGFRFWLQS